MKLKYVEPKADNNISPMTRRTEEDRKKNIERIKAEQILT